MEQQEPTLSSTASTDGVTPPTVTYSAPGAGAGLPTVLPCSPSPGTNAENGVLRTIGQYELLGEVGSGGMGVVYRARESLSGRLVALKMMHGEQNDGSADLQRFILEARATSQLNHPGIIAIHAWGEHQGHPFYTMDFVPGSPLSRILEAGPLPCERAVKYLTGIARAVAAAHAIGIVHRDLKPGNIIIDAGDQPRILDFGLAKRQTTQFVEPSRREEPAEVLPVDEPTAPRRMDSPYPTRLTEKGAILGTPSYMAPEQVRAEHDKIGPAADVHALGAIFCEMLTGRPPYLADNNYEILKQVLRDAPPRLRTINPQVPESLETLCRCCLAKSAKDRYPDAGALADDLERRWHRSIQAKRYARLTLCAALVVLLLGAVQALLAGNRELAPSHLAVLLAERATSNYPLQATAGVLAGLTQGLALSLFPLAAGVAGFIWLTAWLWHADRPGRLGLIWIGGAGMPLLLWLIAGFPLGNLGQSSFVWLAAATPLVVLIALLARTGSGRKRTATANPQESEPYLQKLLGVRTELQSRPADLATERPASLADFEPGKELYSWDGGRVSWGRQPSLDRAVLIWVHTNESSNTGGQTGVMVRHPYVLNLHAVGQGAEGRFLVTEAAAATPLAILLERGPLAPLGAVILAIRLARAVQAFHDQGACHGRLQAEWFLVRGELEPILCPCGIPSSSLEDQARDVQALGQLLGQWLPPRQRGWSFRPQASLYRVCDAACAAVYRRAADLAADLEKALERNQLRRRMRWANYLALALLFGPLLVVAAMWYFDRSGSPADFEAVNNLRSDGRAIGILVAICPCAFVVGCAQVRFWIRRKRLRLSRTARPTIGNGGTLETMIPIGLSACLAVVFGWFEGPESRGAAGVIGTALLALAELGGFWALGACVAGLASGLDLLLNSLPTRSNQATAGEARMA